MPDLVYVALQGDDRIVWLELDPVSGGLTPRGHVVSPGGPAPMVVDPAQRVLHVAQRGARRLASYAIEPGTGALYPLGAAVSLPSDPCYLGMDRRGRFLLSAYYEGGAVAVHPVGADGAVADPPVEWRPTARGAHCIQTDPQNRFAFVPHIAGHGPNEIRQFRFDADSGRLTPNAPPVVRPDGPVGPRHYCFHPSLDIVYFSNEQGRSVTAYRLDPSAGTLSALQTVSTLPAGFQGESTCSQIRMHPSGRFLYAPNRGHNSIASFTVDGASGLLTSTGHAAAEPVPRAFNLDPDGRFLCAAGLESGRLTVFRVDQHTGRPVPLGVHPVGQRPMWVTILRV